MTKRAQNDMIKFKARKFFPRRMEMSSAIHLGPREARPQFDTSEKEDWDLFVGVERKGHDSFEGLSAVRLWGSRIPLSQV